MAKITFEAGDVISFGIVASDGKDCGSGSGFVKEYNGICLDSGVCIAFLYCDNSEVEIIKDLDLQLGQVQQIPENALPVNLKLSVPTKCIKCLKL